MGTNPIRNSDGKITYTWKSKQVSDASLTTLHELITFFKHNLLIRKKATPFERQIDVLTREIDILLLTSKVKRYLRFYSKFNLLLVA